MKAKNKEDIFIAKSAFLNIFPLQEIDNFDVRGICRDYKRGNISPKCAMESLEEHSEYIHNWHINNKACNFFYGKNR
jgi:hypothetical protein